MRGSLTVGCPQRQRAGEPLTRVGAGSLAQTQGVGSWVLILGGWELTPAWGPDPGSSLSARQDPGTLPIPPTTRQPACPCQDGPERVSGRCDCQGRAYVCDFSSPWLEFYTGGAGAELQPAPHSRGRADR